MLPFFRRACQTALEGQTVYSSNFPPRHAQNQARHSEALLPRRGKQRRSRTLAAYPCPAGQGCVIFPPPFPSALEACFPHSPASASDKKGASLFLPERKKSLKRSCPLHPLQLQPQRSAPARTSDARAVHIPVGKRPPSGGQRIAPAGRGCCSSTRTPAPDDTSEKRARAQIEKLCRENAAIRRTKPRRAMPSAAGNAVRPCRSRRFFRAGASYSLAAVL